MIVAAGTADGQAEKSSSGGVDHISQLVLTLHQGEVGIGAFDDVVGTGHQKACAKIRTESIAGEVFLDEAIEGFVVVKRLNDVVPETPGARALAVCFKSVTFGKANEIKPVARKTLAVMRACEDPIDEIIPGLG